MTHVYMHLYVHVHVQYIHVHRELYKCACTLLGYTVLWGGTRVSVYNLNYHAHMRIHRHNIIMSHVRIIIHSCLQLTVLP